MLSAAKKIVLSMPNDNHRGSKVESAHQFGVFEGVLPRTGEFLVLTLEGGVATPSFHRLSADQKWDTEFMSRVKGAARGLKAKAGEDVNDDSSLKRADAHPPDSPIELAPRPKVRRRYIRNSHAAEAPPLRTSVESRSIIIPSLCGGTNRTGRASQAQTGR